MDSRNSNLIRTHKACYATISFLAVTLVGVSFYFGFFKGSSSTIQPCSISPAPPIGIKQENTTTRRTTVFTETDEDSISVDPFCPIAAVSLAQPLNSFPTTSMTMQDLEKSLTKSGSITQGGRYTPKDCRVRYKVAVIVPYVSRSPDDKDLVVFLQHMHPFLQRQEIDYRIYVVFQTGGTGILNKGMMWNIGAKQALKEHVKLDSMDSCFVFHEIDLLPTNDRILYSCPDQPRHMSVEVINPQDNKTPEDLRTFEGVTAMSTQHFEAVNGFTFKLKEFGYDDNMAFRVNERNMPASTYRKGTAQYRTNSNWFTKRSEFNKERASSPPNPETYKDYETDGFNHGFISSSKHILEKKALYTKVTVTVTS